MSALGLDLPCQFFFSMHKIGISHCHSCPWTLHLEENYVGFQLRKAKLVFKDCNSLLTAKLTYRLEFLMLGKGGIRGYNKVCFLIENTIQSLMY